jgi:hypothetical protein
MTTKRKLLVAEIVLEDVDDNLQNAIDVDVHV